MLYFALLGLVLRSGTGKDAFGRLVSYGAFAQLFFQVLVNVGMNMAIIPITGITLPLFSFGGSSIVATCITLGIVSAKEPKKDDTIAIR